jgi:SSS family solute:Na+ symporter
MQLLDWLVLALTLGFVVVYGLWSTRKEHKDSHNFLAGERSLKWWTIGLSIMATQASAITFLSTPGQGYADGLQFVQFYFGLPIAVIILAIFVLPIYYKLRITTAYEYLEQRFDLRMRSMTAVLFLIQRSIAAAISIYAPSIILCAVFGWNLGLTNLFMSAFVVAYTASGGSNAVSKTQELQMTIMLGGLVTAFFVILNRLPEGVGLTEAWQIAGATGKTQIFDWHFSWGDRYNVWSGVLGATFLFLAYFGTDQSQVGRYLSGKSLKESKMGLLFNGFVKIPVQFLVLSVGVMVFVFYQFNHPPLHFNQSNIHRLSGTIYEKPFHDLESRADSLFRLKQGILTHFTNDIPHQTALQGIEKQQLALQLQGDSLIHLAAPQVESKDKDYVFIHFVLSQLPTGLIGLILSMIFCASWSTTASELNALTSTTVSDIYKRSIVKDRDDTHYFRVSRWVTVLWGAFITIFATYADLFDNLIQAVNMVGSIFYGTILGIFFTAFFLKPVKGNAVFYAAVIAQTIIAFLFFQINRDMYLWYNPLGCGLVMGISWLLQKQIFDQREQATSSEKVTP